MELVAYSPKLMNSYADALIRFSGQGDQSGQQYLIPRWYEANISDSKFMGFVSQVGLSQDKSEYTGQPVFIDGVEASFLTWQYAVFENNSGENQDSSGIVLLFSVDWDSGDKWLRAKFPDANFDVLWEGAPMATLTECVDRNILANVVETRRERNNPLGALVDDGIGILNERFRRANGECRFEAFWMQDAPESLHDGVQLSAGRTATAQDTIKPLVDRIAAGVIGEEDAYSEMHAGLKHGAGRYRTRLSATHGTAVADLAFGAGGVSSGSEHERMQEVTLFGVELPELSITESTGVHQFVHLVQAVRWIVYQAIVYQQKNRTVQESVAESVSAEVTVFSPLVINVSLGTHAGDKFGDHFLSCQIDRYLELYETLTRPTLDANYSEERFAHIVYSFGNFQQNNLVSILDRLKESRVNWRIQPDDSTPSFLEIRSSVEDSQELDDAPQPGVAIKPPGQEAVLHYTGQKGQVFNIEDDGKVIGSIYGDMSQGRATTIVAIAPTSSWDTKVATAPAGSWEVSLLSGYRGEPLVVQVQRDDTPGARHRRGRQSYLEPVEGDAPNADTHRYDSPIDPVVALGNHSTWVNSERGVAAGGVYLRPGMDGSPVAVHESSSGAGHKHNTVSGVASPHYVAVTSLSQGQAGVMATGTLSGSSVRISGTSAAAPQVTRYMIETYLDSNNVESVTTDPTSPRLGGSNTVPLAGRSAAEPSEGHYLSWRYCYPKKSCP